jgi:phosphotriesterase-related protein
MTFAETVTGRVPASELGATLMHEHILCDLRPLGARDDGTAWPPITMENRFEVDYFQNRHPPNMWLDDDAAAARDLAALKAAGGGTLVELTVGGIAPQPGRLAALSAQTGVHLVAGAGWDVDAYLDDTLRAADEDALADAIRAQLRDAAWGSAVRCGIIGEIGCTWPLADVERRMLCAAARAQREMGAAITVHPGRHPDAPAEIAGILAAAGAEPSRTVIGHMDRTVFDGARLLALLHRGFVLEWDFFGIETSQYWMADEDLELPTDAMRIDTIYDLMQRGFREQVAISHDICTRTRLLAWGGHGYRHILAHVVPMMRRRGWADREVEQVLVATPARLLAYLSDGGA